MDSGESAYARYLDGDETAVGEIIRDYRDGLTLYINGFVRDLNTAEELCEDAFVKLFTKKPRFHGNSKFRTFLYSFGRNAALDYLRREKRRQNIGLDECGEISDDKKISRKDIFARSAKKRFTRRCQSSKMNSGRCFG